MKQYFAEDRNIRILKFRDRGGRGCRCSDSDFFSSGTQSAFRVLVLLGPILIFLGSLSCEVSDPVSDTSVRPVLSGLQVKDTLYLGSPDSGPVRVQVRDPQGWQDIDRVDLEIYPANNPVPVWADTMRDSGPPGDIIPRDGCYYYGLTSTFAGGVSGDYRIRVYAADLAGHTSDTLEANIHVLSGEGNDPPVLIRTSIPDTVTDASSAEVTLRVHVSDPQGTETVDSVFAWIYPPLNPQPVLELELADDGLIADSAAGDGIFTLQTDLSQTLTIRGVWNVRFQAADKGGLFSRPVATAMFVDASNSPPLIQEVSAPDTVSRSAALPLLITARVTDPQGSSDIRRVAFNSYKPDGVPSSGNPFIMKDDGTQGDALAGDGVFSITVTITPQNARGNYRFDFFAEDQAGAVSEIVTHIVTVVD
jgi:hypothetical protein